VKFSVGFICNENLRIGSTRPKIRVTKHKFAILKQTMLSVLTSLMCVWGKNIINIIQIVKSPISKQEKL
jgi:hypothetical protein